MTIWLDAAATSGVIHSSFFPDNKKNKTATQCTPDGGPTIKTPLEIRRIPNPFSIQH
jgi:hypothetical protein